MKNFDDNPYSSAPVETVLAVEPQQPVGLLAVTVVFACIGLVLGILAVAGVKTDVAEIAPNELVKTEHARTASLGNWIWAICLPIAGALLGLLVALIIRMVGGRLQITQLNRKLE